jgi:hypothetical protein
MCTPKYFASLLGSASSSGHARHLSSSAGSLGMLTSASVAPIVSDTTVSYDNVDGINKQ